MGREAPEAGLQPRAADRPAHRRQLGLPLPVGHDGASPASLDAKALRLEPSVEVGPRRRGLEVAECPVADLAREPPLGLAADASGPRVPAGPPDAQLALLPLDRRPQPPEVVRRRPRPAVRPDPVDHHVDVGVLPVDVAHDEGLVVSEPDVSERPLDGPPDLGLGRVVGRVERDREVVDRLLGLGREPGLLAHLGDGPRHVVGEHVPRLDPPHALLATAEVPGELREAGLDVRAHDHGRAGYSSPASTRRSWSSAARSGASAGGVSDVFAARASWLRLTPIRRRSTRVSRSARAVTGRPSDRRRT